MAKSVKPMFWIYGNRRQSIQAWNKILGILGGADKVNIQSIECGSNPQDAVNKVAEAADIAIRLRQKDLFDSRPRIIKMKGLPEDYLGLTEFLKYINNNNVLVIWGQPGYRNANSSRWTPATNSKFFKTIKEEGQVFEFPMEAAASPQAKRWCSDVAEERGKKFEDDALDRIVELVGKNLDILESEVIKLCNYQTGKTIKKDDVNSCCRSNSLDEVWSFLDMLDLSKADEAILYMQKFYEMAGNEKGETFYGKVSMLFGALEQHFLFTLLSKGVCGEEIYSQKLQDALQGIRKFGSPKKLSDLSKGLVKSEDIGVYFSPQYINMNCSKHSVKSALQWSEKKLYLTYSCLEQCKWACRANSNNETLIRLFLDLFVLAVCDKVSYRDAISIMDSSISYGI